MAVTDKKYSVIIVGAGISGLSSAFHLKQLNIRNVAIISDHSQKAAILAGPGILSGGSTDNFTRLYHAWGPDFAKEVWDFGDLGFRLLTDFCSNFKVKISVGDRIRVSNEPLEVNEMKKASALLTDAGFRSQYDFPSEGLFNALPPGKPQAMQREQRKGGIVELGALKRRLLAEAGETSLINAKVTGVNTLADGIEVLLSNGQTLRAEMIVAAAHLRIPELVKELKDSLISFADQWHRLKFDAEVFRSNDIGSVFSFSHGYAWGAVASQTELLMGGGRQFRKFAGFEATESSINDRSTSYLLKAIEHHIGEKNKPTIESSAGILDCRPCDEIPVIGPMFGENRILIATGYSGGGLTLGFHAGKCIAELIAKGACDTLPLRFHPARLRSLAD